MRRLDHHADVKHRETVLSRCRGELLRESGNRASFDRTKAKVLADRDVQTDPVLLQMVRAFIAEREAAFKAAHPIAPELPSVARTFARIQSLEEVGQSRTDFQQEIHQQVAAMDRQFESDVEHFRPEEARLMLDRLLAVHRCHPEIVDAAHVSRFESTLRTMEERRGRFLRHVDQLAEKAVAASQKGDHDAAARALKRLSSIHALHPRLLPDDHFAVIRDHIIHAGDRQEHQEAARLLIERERAIASEIQRLAATIRQFHQVARSVQHDAEAYRKAEAAYHHAIEEVKSHDAEWLAGTILELADLLSELHDPPPPAAEKQVDQFVQSIRAALAKLRKHVQTEP